jgi:hypothetical protein
VDGGHGKEGPHGRKAHAERQIEDAAADVHQFSPYRRTKADSAWRTNAWRKAQGYELLPWEESTEGLKEAKRAIRGPRYCAEDLLDLGNTTAIA